MPILEKGLDWATVPQRAAGCDVFLWTRTAGWDPGDLEHQARVIKSLEMPTVGAHLDRWWGLNREPDIFRSPFFRLDHVFTADGGHDQNWIEAGVNHHWMPPAILSDEAQRVGVYRADYAVDVGFVGSMRKYGHPEWGPYRLSLFKFLVKTYGDRFKLWEGGIRGQDLADLYASVKVLVGDSCLAGNPARYWSDRIPETLGRGGFLIHPEVEGLRDEYPMLPQYPVGDFDKLRYLIDHYLEDSWDPDDDSFIPGEQLRMAAWNREFVLANHLYEHRLARVLSTVLG